MSEQLKDVHVQCTCEMVNNLYSVKGLPQVDK